MSFYPEEIQRKCKKFFEAGLLLHVGKITRFMPGSALNRLIHGSTLIKINGAITLKSRCISCNHDKLNSHLRKYFY